MLRLRRPGENGRRRPSSGDSSQDSSPLLPRGDGAQQDDEDDPDTDLDDKYRDSDDVLSGYEFEPIERYLVITRWQKRLHNVQRRLRLHRMRQEFQETAEGATANPQGGEQRAPRRRSFDAVAMKLREGPKKVVGTMRERQQIFQQKYQKQMKELKGRLDQSLARVRSSKARQLRHMFCFFCSMCDLVVTAVWTGASPWTLHWYITFKCAGLIGFRALWYRWLGCHYFLLDLCYFSNLMLMLYIWVLPSNEDLFQAVYGLTGVLLISTIVFRNSFVPHSLDRVTSVQIHVSPVLQLWVLRWYSNGRPVWWADQWSQRCLADTLLPRDGPCVFRIPTEFSIVPVLCLYLVWISGYCFNQFVWNRKVIEREGYETLYTHMAYDLGILKKLPKKLQGPIASRAVFVAGHFGLFCAGLPCVHAPFLLHTIFLCVAIMWCFKNGATFYITYFWRVYEKQIHAFERQMAEASAGSSQSGAAPQSPEGQPLTPCSVCATDNSSESPKEGQPLTPCSVCATDNSSESPKVEEDPKGNADGEEDNDTVALGRSALKFGTDC